MGIRLRSMYFLTSELDWEHQLKNETKSYVSSTVQMKIRPKTVYAISIRTIYIINFVRSYIYANRYQL